MMARIGKSLFVVFAIVASLVGQAIAVPVTYEFEGTFTSADPVLPFSAPTPVRGTYTVDSEAPPTPATPIGGTEYALETMTVEIPSAAISATSTGGMIEVFDNFFGLDRYTVSSTNFSPVQTGLSLLRVELDLRDMAGTIFSDEILPAVLPAIRDFDFADISLLFDVAGGSRHRAEASVDYVGIVGQPTAPVPELSTLLLVGGGVLALSAGAWRRHRRQ